MTTLIRKLLIYKGLLVGVFFFLLVVAHYRRQDSPIGYEGKSLLTQIENAAFAKPLNLLFLKRVQVDYKNYEIEHEISVNRLAVVFVRQINTEAVSINFPRIERDFFVLISWLTGSKGDSCSAPR